MTLLSLLSYCKCLLFFLLLVATIESLKRDEADLADQAIVANEAKASGGVSSTGNFIIWLKGSKICSYYVFYLVWYVLGGVGAAVLAGGLTWAALKWREARARRRAAPRSRGPTPPLLAQLEEGAIQTLEGASAVVAAAGPFRPIPLHPSNPFYGDVVGAGTPPHPRVPEEVEDDDEDEFFDW